MELVGKRKAVLVETEKSLQGSTCRLCMARIGRTLGTGGQRLAERTWRWNRGTRRKGEQEQKHEV